MSLNGLDEAAVIEAHQAALAEPGGWFLLKYVTRDTVGLLQSGTGGVVEVRSAIEQYQEQSPAYGLVQYRRRKIVLKYVPEGTSRLFQARLTVQFQSVLERFTPYDTVYSFTAATEMTDSALSAACSLHTSIVSLASSTSSLQRRRLVEITEDAEEDGSERRKSGLRHSTLSNADSSFNEPSSILPSQAPTTPNLLFDSHLSKGKGTSIDVPHSFELHPIPVPDKSLPSNSTKVQRTSVDGSAPFEEANGAIEEQVYPSIEDPWGSPQSRHSDQSTHPSALGLDRASSSAEYRPYTPKIKLGPRPSTQRPRTRGSRAEARPVANLPNSVRISTRLPSFGRRPPSSASHRPISQQSNKSAHSIMTNQYASISPPPLAHPSIHKPALYQPANHYLLSRPTSPVSSIAPSVATSTTSTATSKITPEKLRLMRALELRKKQHMAKSCQTHPPIQPSSRRESWMTMPQVTSPYSHSHPDPDQTKKDSYQDSKPQAMRDSNRSSQLLASSEAITPSISGAKAPAYESHPATERIGHPPIDPSLDGKDANIVTSLAEPGSDTFKSSRSSVEPTAVPLSMAPIRPPIEVQNTPCTGASVSPMQPDPGRLQKTDPIINTTKVKEEEETMDAAVRVPIPQTVSAPSTTVMASSYSLVSEFDSARDDRPVMLNVAQDLDSGFADQRSGREGALKPDNEVLGPEASDTSDDESLYDEFQNATVEQAKPVMIARSGVNAVSNSSTLDRQRQPNRSVSSPHYTSDQDSRCLPEKAEVVFRHSSSSALPNWPPTGGPAQSMPIPKSTVSSGISKRIRALEIFSGAGSSSPTAATPPIPLTASLVQKRISSQSLEGTVAHNMATSSTATVKQRPYPRAVATPTSAQATTEHRSSWIQGEGPRAEVVTTGRKGDSVSVTARIIRDSDMIKSIEPGGSSKPAAMSLHRSPLVVEHQKGYLSRDVEPAVIPVGSREPEPPAAETSNIGRRRFSLSSAHSSSGKLPQPESLKKRLSMTIRHARTESGNLTQSASDPLSIGENKSVKEPRKKNRLKKRMSVLTASSRRNIGASSNALRQREYGSAASQPPPSVADHSGARSGGMSSIAESHAHVVDIGDVNIQFPDTLLWKRRFMRIDNQGFLILTPPTMEPNNRGISRRFHLSDIKKPSLPTVEREELPWSIVLDFDDGSCLQCACESKYAQGQVLNLLTDAHAAYRSLYMQS